jgi:hypothetical protein
VLKILNQRLRVSGGKDIAFDDAVVKERIKDIRTVASREGWSFIGHPYTSAKPYKAYS